MVTSISAESFDRDVLYALAERACTESIEYEEKKAMQHTAQIYYSHLSDREKEQADVQADVQTLQQHGIDVEHYQDNFYQDNFLLRYKRPILRVFIVAACAVGAKLAYTGYNKIKY
jgi:ketopantoate reductase